MSFLSELKRRNVFRVGAAYLVSAWLLLQVLDVVSPILGLPDVFGRYLLFLLVAGFIPALLIAWIFELTPQGVRRESDMDPAATPHRQGGRKLDRAIIVVLALAVGLLLVDRFILGEQPAPAGEERAAMERPAEVAAPASAGPVDNGQKSVAVLPFVPMSNGPDDNYFADGLTEEIINSLAQLPTLLVTARTSAFHFKDQNLPVTEIARQLGVGNVVEGSVRRAGEQLRITAQLIRASDGFHLWSETYSRKTADTLAVQEDIAEKVAVALNVVLDEDARARMRRAGTGNVEAFTEYQKGRELFLRAHDSDNVVAGLRRANEHFEKALSLEPGIPNAYLSINDIYSHVLIENARGFHDGEVTDQDVASAPSVLRRNFDRAIEYTQNEAQRMSILLDRAIILGDWIGLADLTARALELSGCQPSFWVQLSSSAWGAAGAAEQAFRKAVLCDPHRTEVWNKIARAQLWAGDFAGVESTAREASRKVGASDSMLASALVKALAQAGRIGEAQQANNNMTERESVKLLNRVAIAAIEGDADRAAELQDRYMGAFGNDDVEILNLEAIRGNRNEANSLARRMDSRAGGHVALLIAVYSCICGAPFDLEAAPEFASRLAVSGLCWPPPTPIQFPLKNW